MQHGLCLNRSQFQMSLLRNSGTTGSRTESTRIGWSSIQKRLRSVKFGSISSARNIPDTPTSQRSDDRILHHNADLASNDGSLIDRAEIKSVDCQMDSCCD